MKPLIIDEPWVTAILKGAKTWEMLKRNCNIRGQIALVRKKSGHVVGAANVVPCGPPLATRADYVGAEQQHRIKTIGAGVYKLITHTRLLAIVRSHQKAVRYKHPPGAVVRSNLDPEVAAEVLAQATK
ncbi:ASCH domain-containing protein [Bradyrhizobium ottawaense]|uniref:hypothetical protein n=1 Tax=Bradyrhizobium ottawaense TaxID=931866 RepID=UPI0006767919|nr:hypothetical protein [Bradyrhizobium ottawaense]